MSITPASFRFDRRTGTLRCKPPNRRCGGRCIPPSWDCRLKGEGNDNHLKAAGRGSDPIAGFASVERGFSRLAKGAVKLSFSEVEGGRRALARGAAKLSPGDLQQKKELQQTVYNYGLIVGAPVTVAIFAALSHKGLKSFRGYREGPGRQIDEAVGGAFRNIQRNTPFGVGEGIRNRERAGVEAVVTQVTNMRNLEAAGPSARERRAGSGSFLQRLARERSATEDAIVHQLRLVDAVNGKASKLKYAEWEERSLSSFWATPRPKDSVPAWAASGDNTSLFAVDATNNLITRSFNISPFNELDTPNRVNSIVTGIAKKLGQSGEQIRISMREAGLNSKSPEDVSRYIRSVPLGPGVPPQAQERAYQTLEAATLRTDYTGQARSFYNSTLKGFDQFFRQLSTTVNDRPGIQTPSDIRSRSFWRDGTLAHADILARRIGFDVGPLRGTATATVVKKAYHATQVATSYKKLFKTTVSLTRTEAMTAASEIAEGLGRPAPDTADAAIAFLNETLGGGGPMQPNRLRGLTLVQAPVPERPARGGAAQPTSTPRPARRRSQAQQLAAIRRERNPDGTPRYATPEAAMAELRRRQGRTDAQRLDYTPPNQRLGKPCGKGFVTKAKKCSKPTSRRYAEKPQRQATSPRGRKSYPSGYIPNETKKSHRVGKDTANTVKKVLTTAVAVGALTAAAKNRRALGRKLKTATPELYRQAKVRAKLARKSGRKLQKNIESAHLSGTVKVINALSSQEVRQGLERIPEQYRDTAKGLIGRAKTGMAAMLMYARGSELINVDAKNNHSTFKLRNGDITSVGSVGDTLVMFRTHPEKSIDFGAGQVVERRVVDFTVDLQHGRSEQRQASQGLGVVRSVKTMFKEQLKYVPDESFVTAEAYGKDDLGDRRRSIYEKFGFTSIGENDSVHLWGLKTKGEFKRLNKRQVYSIKTALRTNSRRGDSAARTRRRDAIAQRLDKKCGKTGIAKHKKCTKPIIQRVAEVAATAAAVGVVGFNTRKVINIARTVAQSTGKLKRPANKPASDWLDTPNSPGMHEGHRMRTYAANQKMREVTAPEMADQVRKLGGNKKVADLIKRHNLKLTPKVIENIERNKSVMPLAELDLQQLREQLSTAPQMEGFYLDPNHPAYGKISPNEVYVNFRREDNAVWNPSATKIKANMAQYQQARAKTTETTEQIHADPTPEKLKNYMDSFMTYSTAQGDERDYLLGLHEMAHALDIGLGKRQRPSAIGNKPIDPTQFVEQAKVVTSGYGQTDLLTRADEFFAESFVLYTASPDYLKAKAPIVYDWVDTYMDKLLALNP